MRERVPGIGIAAVVLAVLAWVDLGFVNLRSATGQALVVEAVLLAGAAWLVDRQGRAGRNGVLVGLGVLAAAVSVLVTWFVARTVLQREPGLVALMGLLLVVAGLCRWLPVRWLVVVPVPLFALVCLGQRLPAVLASAPAGDAGGWFGLLGLVAAGWGVSRRVEDARRRAAEEQVRRDERLELARDLHDDVAHHVTAMIVLAQAGEQLAERDPAQARRLFADLERTGQEGLVAMSRMVRLLRSARPEAATAPEHPLQTVRSQIARFSDGGTRAELHLGVGVDEQRWSPELAKSVQRLVQEGLTNVRKHARGATAVHVDIDQDGGRVTVRVRNDGSRSGRVRRFRPSGFGMVGLSERVGALGGELAGGPVDGGGWQLAASLPGPSAVAR